LGVLHPHHNVVPPRVTGVGNVGFHAVAAFVGALVHGVDDSASATKKAIECRCWACTRGRGHAVRDTKRHRGPMWGQALSCAATRRSTRERKPPSETAAC